MAWIAPDVERSEHYPERRNEPEREMLRDWLDWHRATLLRKCAGTLKRQLAHGWVADWSSLRAWVAWVRV